MSRLLDPVLFVDQWKWTFCPSFSVSGRGWWWSELPLAERKKGRQIWFRTPRGENGNDNLVFFFLNGNLTRVGLLMLWGVYLKYLIVYKWLDCSTSRFKVWTFDSVEAGGMSHDTFHELLSATRSAVSGDAVLGCRRHITHLANMRRCHVSWVPPVGLDGGWGIPVEVFTMLLGDKMSFKKCF